VIYVVQYVQFLRVRIIYYLSQFSICPFSFHSNGSDAIIACKLVF